MPTVKYRSQNPNLVPRRTRLEIPGWAGQPEPRANGSHEHPWHCVPFSEAATAGIELPYPHPHELVVRQQDGAPVFTGEGMDLPLEDPGRPPFRSFGAAYYTYRLLLDLKVEPGLALKAETHPRFYSDSTHTVPIAVPAVLQHWWPMIYFVVFKTPAPGQVHIFRPGEPFIQFTVVAADDRPDLVDMPPDEAAERELQSQRIYASRSTLSAETQWTSSTATVFDGTYRRIHTAWRNVSRK